MPRVLRIINRFNVGGPTYNAAYLTKFISPEFETRLIGGSPAPGEAHSGYILDELGIQYEEIEEMSRSLNPIHDIRAFLKIRKIIREFKPDIVHTHAAKAGALGRIAAKLEKVPVIVHTYHGHVFSNYFSRWKSKLVRRVERFLANRTNAVVVISPLQFEEIVNRFKIVSSSKTHVIPLGFDLSKFNRDQEKKRREFRSKYHLNDEDVAIGIIGRFAPVKNHVLFFDALRELHQKSKAWRAFVIGDGNGKEEMIESISDLLSSSAEDKERITFTSWIKNIDEAMAGLDIIVLTSLNEGTPVTLIEAQAAGKPVVSTDVGGVRDCITINKSGFVTTFEATDIAQKIEQLVINQALRNKMGNEGKELVTHRYSYLRLCSDMSSLYHQLLKK